MNEPIHITLLGSLQIQQGERLITRFKSQKIGALLAYCHLNPMHSREVLIDLLWPESTLEAGRNSLSVALSTLRHQLEPPGIPANAVLRADRFSVGLNPAAVITDVARFESAIQAATRARSATEHIQRLTDAVDFYQGRLLPGFYEEWIPLAQEQMAGLFLETVTRLILRMEENGDLEGALRYARRAVGIDPLQEQAHQHLIRLLAATGQPGAALRHYKELERLLEAEMGEEPSAPLRALARQIEKQSGFTAPLTLPAVAALPRTLSPSLALVGLPEGPVTLTVLMTDIEGSTRLWERSGEAFAQALMSHHALLRREFARYGGQEINEAGDSFVVAFSSAGKALDCAVRGQQALLEHAWPQEVGALRVRMALHTGDVEYQEGAYHGLTLHRASRMLTSGHGGQVLCSEATASLVRRDLSEAVRLVDLGVWRLRDLPAPERLFQVEYPGMPDEAFPPLSAEGRHSGRLPLRFTRFFGREGAITRLVGMLQPEALLPAPKVRLVTLTGSGGAGKTRLALEVAERLVEPLQGAVWFTPLADLTDPGLIADTILASLRLIRSPHREALEQVVEALSRQPCLLVLDNFEHLVLGAALVQALLTRVPTLTVLVTSRQLLGLSGEQEFVVPPLVTPNGGETAEQLSLYESVQLFVDRAQAAMPHFQVTSGNAPAVAELCHRLEGLPLAIELAAARALVLTPAQMLRQLEQRFEFLVSRKRDATERHRTLEAAIDWSYRLLTPEVQRFFARLSVFRGGCTAEAAEGVCDQPLALDYLAQLRECSLVLAEEVAEGEEIRFRMLETLREYGKELMMEAERAQVEDRHAEYFLALAERAEPNLWGAEQGVWLQQLAEEHENLRAAMERSLSGGVSGVGLRLCGALQQYWATRGHLSEGRAWSERVLGEASAQARTPERGKVLNGAGALAYFQGDYTSAWAYFEESLSLLREIGNRAGIAYSLNGLGKVAHNQGDYASARAYQEESLSLLREIGNPGGIALSLRNLGRVACSQGDYVSARFYYEESLSLQREIGNRRGIVYALEAFAGLMVAQEQREQAGRLWGAAEALREEIGFPFLTSEREKYDRNLAAARTVLDEEAFSKGWAEGRGMTMEQAIAYALEAEEPV